MNEIVSSRPASILGDSANTSFGSLPYLLKLLSAARPLSVQVHPDKDQARRGFDLEQAAGVPLDSPQRCYRDRNHKPELLVALSSFDALCGFRPMEEIASSLGHASEVRDLLPRFDHQDPEDLRALFEAYFALPRNLLNPALSRLLERFAAREGAPGFDRHDPGYWALRTQRELASLGPPDPGLISFFLLSLIHLEPGEALFLPPGTPHAYLHGSAVEVMAASDNVVRAGLTSKHVDVEEALRLFRFDQGPPSVLEPTGEGRGGELRYTVPAGEFELRCLPLCPGASISRLSRGPEILLALPEAKAAVEISLKGEELVLGSGEACLIPDGLRYSIKTSAPAKVFLAGVPSTSAGCSR